MIVGKPNESIKLICSVRWAGCVYKTQRVVLGTSIRGNPGVFLGNPCAVSCSTQVACADLGLLRSCCQTHVLPCVCHSMFRSLFARAIPLACACHACVTPCCGDHRLLACCAVSCWHDACVSDTVTMFFSELNKKCLQVCIVMPLPSVKSSATTLTTDVLVLNWLVDTQAVVGFVCILLSVSR